LSHAQKRFYLDEFSPLTPDEPVVASRIAATLRAAAQGTLREDEFTAEFWSHLAPALRGMQDQINQLGSLQHVTLVGRSVTTGRSVYQAVIDFAGARVLQRFEFSPEGKFSGIATEFVEQTRP
jgi:hypothetical protein